MPKLDWIKKVLILGSGAVRIGQAGEFDYSGSQALKAMKEEGIETVLVNPNIATIQTDPGFADKVYLLPVTPYFVEEIIRREKPDGILLSFGGQTALNCGVELAKSGVLEKYNVEILGTPVRAIELTEDRELFRRAMMEAGVNVLESATASSVDVALKIAEKIGYPVMVRVAYTLGGQGSGVAHNKDELEDIVSRALAQSMISQVLIERYVGKWKEIEYEVVRDSEDNCITVCNMENFDPMGIHTGESIVVAPSQTLTNKEYRTLREASIRVIRYLGIIGECNIQYALDPKSLDFYAVEVNARLSRSSALASKATGYPLAYIAAKLAIGYTLPELTNKVTGVTTACFEPALDYVVVKIPRWDLQKFINVNRHIGTQMKSVGEVMAIGRCFEEAIQKAVRMLDIGALGLVGNVDEIKPEPIEHIKYLLANPTDERIFKIVKALKKGVSVDEIYALSGIDRWFLYKIQNIIDMEEYLKNLSLDSQELKKALKEAKRLGFSDEQIANCLNTSEDEIRKLRKKLGILPVVNQIDTLAAEWPAKTNYLYLTYGGEEDDITFESKKKVIVLGAGTYRIGSSVEFDWCCVNTTLALKNNGVEEAIMVNYNPETVSTDYDMSDKLYFEELSFERVMDIYEKENPLGIIVSVGGQMPNNIAMKLSSNGVKILGTSAEDIDRAEDRAKFSALLDSLNIPQPPWQKLSSLEEAKNFANKVGYPVLVRPSYVLSGAAMRVAYSDENLEDFLVLAAKVSKEHPVVISKFIEEAREVEVDGVCDGEDVLIGAVIEHVEDAGVHSGDATMSIPTHSLSRDMIDKVEHYSRRIAKALNIKGPFNIQYLVKNGEVYVIECNLRASRSMPFVSKTKGINLMEKAAAVMLGKKLRDINSLHSPEIHHTGIKVPQFSFMRLEGADPVLGVEMVSTGEVACLGESFDEAFLKALLAAEFKVPLNGGSVLISVGGKELKDKLLPIAKEFSEMGYKIYATEHTAEAFLREGLDDVKTVYKMRETQRKPNIRDYLVNRKIDLVINIVRTGTLEKFAEMMSDEYLIRRKATEYNIPVITNLKMASALVRALKAMRNEKLSVKSLNEYIERVERPPVMSK
ncbi:MAG: carbamoyl-phosphate synthase (glutamine-hydrolyzing) large subunit [Candidatus Freyarchaeota archaeon]|nr:carbamoyl-phosphate synthase (glutamine-hydrolyzing) large subunit [Candidatus Jordarchaeia archaeon]MBS7268543.1 carbamoyl-phosphate synthase (glutamine-hydrolyzing) large subunit [Candidatus Jordarchaeia archaeon]MBS7279273.1 carbamoyl-phosphate synthase (glutamine-hydrolyzing) large subunit [Candidatus Jordarchaeia archaeon]